MKSYSADELQARILKVACEMDCKNIQAAKQGQASIEVNKNVFELMFIHEFLPGWDANKRRQVECLLNAKFKI